MSFKFNYSVIRYENGRTERNEKDRGERRHIPYLFHVYFFIYFVNTIHNCQQNKNYIRVHRHWNISIDLVEKKEFFLTI